LRLQEEQSQLSAQERFIHSQATEPFFFLQGNLLKSSQSAVEEAVRHHGQVEEAQADYKIRRLLLQQAPTPLQLGKEEVEESYHHRPSHNLEEIQQLDLLSLHMEVDMEVCMPLHPQEDVVEVEVIQQEHKDTQEVVIVVVEVV